MSAASLETLNAIYAIPFCSASILRNLKVLAVSSETLNSETGMSHCLPWISALCIYIDGNLHPHDIVRYTRQWLMFPVGDLVLCATLDGLSTWRSVSWMAKFKDEGKRWNSAGSCWSEAIQRVQMKIWFAGGTGTVLWGPKICFLGPTTGAFRA